MNVVKLKLKNFKCFPECSIDLNNLTVLLGANATGKSSILQSILFYLNAVTKMHHEGKAHVSLYQDFGYDLGTIENLIYRNAIDNQIVISVGDDDVLINLNDNVKLSDTVSVSAKPQDISFSYLCAERIGPRNTVEYHNASNCGIHGEYTAYIINRENYNTIDKEKFLDSELEGNFSTQLDNWVQYLFPNMKIQVDCHFNKIAQLKVKAGMNSILTTNIGFGLSYSLPILVEGLCLEKDSWFIVENPEAHLQPKAQTQMGYFLARMAASGIRVVVETHSEHVLEGIAAVTDLGEFDFGNDKVSVYFTEQIDGKSMVREVPISNMETNQDDYPKDFFDYDKEKIKNETPNAQRLEKVRKQLQKCAKTV